MNSKGSESRLRRRLAIPLILLTLGLVGCGRGLLTANQSTASPQVTDSGGEYTVGSNVRIHLDHLGPYTWTSPPIAGLSSQQVQSAGAGRVITGGTADITDFQVKEKDDSAGLDLVITFTVNSIQGDPYLVIVKSGVRTNG